MDEFSPFYKLSRLIAKYLAEDIEISDEKELEDWLNQDEANRQLFNRLINGPSFNEWEKTLNSVNPEKSWAEFEKRLNGKPKRISLFNVLKYAAIVILLISVGTLITLYSQKSRNLQCYKELIQQRSFCNWQMEN